MARFPVALTFDDGYLNHYFIARFLARRGIRATFFVVTHLKMFEGRPLLTINPKLIQEIHSLGHEVGSHTCTHPDLTKLSVAEVEKEVKNSKEYLSELLGNEVVSFAYPGGSYNATVVSVVRKYYKYARLGGRRFEDGWNVSTRNRYMIGGLGVKELFKLPLKYLIHKNIRPVIIMHRESLATIKLVLEYLSLFNPRFLTLSELGDKIWG